MTNAVATIIHALSAWTVASSTASSSFLRASVTAFGTASSAHPSVATRKSADTVSKKGVQRLYKEDPPKERKALKPNRVDGSLPRIRGGKARPAHGNPT